MFMYVLSCERSPPPWSGKDGVPRKVNLTPKLGLLLLFYDA